MSNQLLSPTTIARALAGENLSIVAIETDLAYGTVHAMSKGLANNPTHRVLSALTNWVCKNKGEWLESDGENELEGE